MFLKVTTVAVLVIALAVATISRGESFRDCGFQASYEWLMADLQEGRQGHQSWAVWLESNRVEGQAFSLAVGTAADQWRHVAHYDQRIAAVNEIAAPCFASWY